jgi:SAM-dependent MidA family methyltransferase
MNKMKEILQNMLNKKPNNRMTFKEYMETVLYHPKEGYYNKAKDKIGKSGDFYTNSNIHPVFAKVFVHTFVDILQKEKLDPVICEVGAGTGLFAKEVLHTLKENYPDLYEKVTYIIIEGSPFHREQQMLKLPTSKVMQFDSIEKALTELPSFNGVIYSNELFDALPVHIVEKNDNAIYEVMVELDQLGNLREVKKICDDSELIKWISKYYGDLQDGQRFEVPLAMTNMINILSKWLKKGVLITVDYGYTNEQWALPEHRLGSVRGYRNHQMMNNPLAYPGDIDLTTHIHLDPFIEIGNEAGLKFVSCQRQDQFLISAGIIEMLQEHYDPNPFSEVSKQNRAIRQFISPGGISNSFTVIIQEKGCKLSEQWALNNSKYQFEKS